MVVLIAMILGEVFERFISESPLVVMLRVVLEQSLSAEEVDRIFLDNAQQQYEKEVLFSTVVSLMSVVVCGIAKSVNSAYQSNAKQVGVKGYRVKILDGNHLSASERRLAVLRSVASAPLPGQALVVLDPALQLAIDVFACEDGHAQERSLIPRVLKTVKPKDLWIEDRNFCTLGFLFGIHVRGAFFAVRQHANLPWTGLGELRPVGESETGKVFEQPIQVVLNDSLKIILRRIVVQLLEPTRDGHTELAILTTLPKDVSGLGACWTSRIRNQIGHQVLSRKGIISPNPST